MQCNKSRRYHPRDLHSLCVLCPGNHGREKRLSLPPSRINSHHKETNTVGKCNRPNWGIGSIHMLIVCPWQSRFIKERNNQRSTNNRFPASYQSTKRTIFIPLKSTNRSIVAPGEVDLNLLLTFISSVLFLVSGMLHILQ